MEILCNLSICEVTILQIVSKNWNNSVSDPAFHKLHMQKQRVKESMLFFHRMVTMYPFSQSTLLILHPNQHTLTQLARRLIWIGYFLCQLLELLMESSIIDIRS